MRISALAGLLLLGNMMPVWAAQEAGQVLFVAGTVTVERTETIALSKSDAIFEQDVIVTAERSRGQLLMRDGAKFALRPDTQFVVQEYFLAGDERVQPDGSVVVAAQDSAVTGLIKGGFRTITGAIGKDNPAAYVVETPGATMGIRGTHYSAVWCDSDCELPPGLDNANPIDDGLYIGVTEGSVTVRNLTGEYTLGAGEFVYVKDRSSAPVRLPDTPTVLIDTYPTDAAPTEEAAQEVAETIAALGQTSPDEAFGSPASRPPPDPDKASEGEGAKSGSATQPGGTSFEQEPNDGSNSGFEAEPVIPFVTSTGECLTCGGPISGRPVAMAIGSLLGMNAVTSSSNTGIRTFSGNDLTVFQAPFATNSDTTTYAMGTSFLQDDGFDPVSGIGWGRWSGQTARVTRLDGSVVNVDLSRQSLHWVYGPPPGASTTAPITGTANYSLIVGNTDPTDTLGNSGILGSASLAANFTTATVQSELLLAVGGFDWTASGTGTITNNLFDGIYNNVLIGGQGGGSGNFSGFFGAQGSNGFPNGAGLTYGLVNGQGVSVSGAVVFGPPAP